MRLSKTRVPSEHFNHPFYRLHLPDTLPEERKFGLICEIKAGSVLAAHEAILTHLRLALNIVGRYMTLLDNKTRSDELVSAATEGLCHGVQKIKEGELKHENLTGFLTEYMHRFISECLEKTAMVCVPARTKRHKKQHGEELLQPVTRELTNKVIEKKFDKKIKTTTDLELTEIIDKLVASELERSIIQLRIEGNSDLDVANQLGLSNTVVFMIRRDMQKRFVDFFGDFENGLD